MPKPAASAGANRILDDVRVGPGTMVKRTASLYAAQNHAVTALIVDQEF